MRRLANTRGWRVCVRNVGGIPPRNTTLLAEADSLPSTAQAHGVRPVARPTPSDASETEDSYTDFADHHRFCREECDLSPQVAAAAGCKSVRSVYPCITLRQ